MIALSIIYSAGSVEYTTYIAVYKKVHQLSHWVDHAVHA